MNILIVQCIIKVISAPFCKIEMIAQMDGRDHLSEANGDVQDTDKNIKGEIKDYGCEANYAEITHDFMENLFDIFLFLFYRGFFAGLFIVGVFAVARFADIFVRLILKGADVANPLAVWKQVRVDIFNFLHQRVFIHF